MLEYGLWHDESVDAEEGVEREGVGGGGGGGVGGGELKQGHKVRERQLHFPFLLLLLHRTAAAAAASSAVAAVVPVEGTAAGTLALPSTHRGHICPPRPPQQACLSTPY